MKSFLSFFKWSGVKGKFNQTSFFFLVLIIANLLVTYYLIDQKHKLSSKIQVGTEQMVNVQNYTKSFFYFMETKNMSNVTTVVKNFERNHFFLENGITSGFEKYAELEDPNTGLPEGHSYQMDGKKKEELINIKKSWDEMKALAVSLIAMEPEQKVEGYNKLVSHTEMLEAKILNMVNGFKDESMKASEYLTIAQVALFGISFLVMVLALWTINRRLRVLTTCTSKIRSSSTVATKVAEDLKEGASKVKIQSGQQSSAVHETISAMTELKSIVERTVNISKSQLEAAEEVLNKTDVGKREVSEISQVTDNLDSSIMGMDEVFKKIDTESQTKLEEVIQVIEEVHSNIDVINSIAYKTEMLSFNASIEAARAGVHGKGFSVVANEVGNLARLTAQSSELINNLVKDSRDKVSQIIKSVGHTVGSSKEHIDRCKELSEKTRKAVDETAVTFSGIGELVQESFQKSKEITESAVEQKAGLDEIKSSMDDIQSGTILFKEISTQNDHAAVKMKDTSSDIDHEMDQLLFILNGSKEVKETASPKKRVVKSVKSEQTEEAKLDSLVDEVVKKFGNDEFFESENEEKNNEDKVA